MWMVLVMLIIALALSGIFLWIKYSIKKSEEKKYYDAAARMIKENCLNKIIQNRGQRRQTVTDKLMIYISISGKSRQGFVFDPENGIRIGRNIEENEICIVMHLFRVVIVTSICIRDSQLYRISIPQMEHLSREDYSISIRLMDGNISIQEIRC